MKRLRNLSGFSVNRDDERSDAESPMTAIAEATRATQSTSHSQLPQLWSKFCHPEINKIKLINQIKIKFCRPINKSKGR